MRSKAREKKKRKRDRIKKKKSFNTPRHPLARQSSITCTAQLMTSCLPDKLSLARLSCPMGFETPSLSMNLILLPLLGSIYTDLYIHLHLPSIRYFPLFQLPIPASYQLPPIPRFLQHRQTQFASFPPNFRLETPGSQAFSLPAKMDHPGKAAPSPPEGQAPSPKRPQLTNPP